MHSSNTCYFAFLNGSCATIDACNATMVALREIPRTAAFAWSPDVQTQYLATGTKAGAVDEGFSNETQLELWDLHLDHQNSEGNRPIRSVNTDARFNDIAWSKEKAVHGKGIVAGGLETGCLDLWDADKLLEADTEPFLSRTSKHSGSIRALQFNAFRSELLATVGAKGELFISDINNAGSPFRMGNAVARADDFECLDWNKRTSHIMVTGSSGGIITVWDIKNKRESLTLNNTGRRPVSAIAWDPFKTTRLVTAVPSDSDPVICVWDLRNANAPERTLKGHDGGILSLAWCQQDGDLLLSCGKDNRNICWNPQSGESNGEFPVVTNWTFQTRWNPQNPQFMATASFDGKISVNTMQNTQTDDDSQSVAPRQQVDDEDFFNKAQAQPQGTKFTLKKAPKWLQRPCGASFAFGGKIATFKTSSSGNTRRSMVRISEFALDDGLVSALEAFETSLKQGDFGSICDAKLKSASKTSDKSDWGTLKLLTTENHRAGLLDYLKLPKSEAVASPNVIGEPSDTESNHALNEKKGRTPANNRLSTFFDDNAEADNFLSELAASKGARANNPFSIYTGSESVSNKDITQALLLGNFERAMEICISEQRIADAFMIATCGGQSCIKKAQEAYFNQKGPTPNYLRLLASIVGKNLWDLVHNADLTNWKEIMAAICTYAAPDEFSDLCEVLGDRVSELASITDSNATVRDDASFCYMAGARLEKVVNIWLSDLREDEQSSPQADHARSRFSLHARVLQNFIEKVTVLRSVTKYRDEQLQESSGWNLLSLYEKYIEYADIASAHGQLQVAERYLNLLPSQYAAADVAKGRIEKATQKTTESSSQPQASGRTTSKTQAGIQLSPQESPHAGTAPASAQSRQYPSTKTQRNPYAPVNGAVGAGAYAGPNYHQQQQQPQQQTPLYGTQFQSGNFGAPGAPPRAANSSPIVPPPSKASNMGNWNDMPESFFKAPSVSRRGTPSAVATNHPSQLQQNFVPSPPVEAPPKASSLVGPPPKTGTIPAKVGPPAIGEPVRAPDRPPSLPNVYAPSTTSLPAQAPSTVARGPSPYNAPPTVLPASNRYAPSQPTSSSRSESPMMPPNGRQPAPPPNPYAPKQTPSQPSTGPPPRQQIQPPPAEPSRTSTASQNIASSLKQEDSTVPPSLSKSARSEHRKSISHVQLVHTKYTKLLAIAHTYQKLHCQSIAS